jgi:hypothetical protein
VVSRRLDALDALSVARHAGEVPRLRHHAAGIDALVDLLVDGAAPGIAAWNFFMSTASNFGSGFISVFGSAACCV